MCFYALEAKWCGRIISGSGVRHDPSRLSALQALPSPVNGADLQQFVCTVGSMRTSIPGFSAIVQPLTALLEKGFAQAGGRKNSLATRVLLADVGWSSQHDICLATIKTALNQTVELCHADPTKRL